MTSPREPSSAICILGMHRSGTSAVTRAVNLLGAYLGEPEKFGVTGADNPKGHWEHPDILALQRRALACFGRKWSTVMPLPSGWHRSETIQPVKKELTQLIDKTFTGHPLWSWKDPQTCLLVPLWRDILESLHTKMSCLYVVRNPIEVAGSLAGRNAFQFNNGLGIWFHYNIAALKDSAGLPIVFLSYERFLAAWELELRRCLAALGLQWPADEKKLRASMESFVDPKLRHNQADGNRLKELPLPVQELYQLLDEACRAEGAVRTSAFELTVNRLSNEFHGYAPLFDVPPEPPRPAYLKRTWNRWQRSINKRLPK